MKGSPKPLPPATKLARGTYRPDRDAHTFQMNVPGDPPQMPDGMTAQAQSIWAEEIGRAMAAGVVELDSTLFANYCSLAWMIRSAFASSEPPPASHLAELRRMAELLGLAGPKSRTFRPTPGQTNAFARNGRRSPAE